MATTLLDNPKHPLTRAQLEATLDASPLGVSITRYYDGYTIYVNSTLASWGKMTVDEIVGTNSITYYRDKEDIAWVVNELKEDRPVTNHEMKMNRADGSYVWRQVTMIAMWVDEERIILTWFNDITELREARDRLIYTAKHDSLTRLANIGYFDEYLQQTVEQAARDMTPSSLLYLDLDGFKQINDNYGHQQGNKVLIEVVARMKRCIGENDFAARIGGDEFALIIESAGNGVSAAINTATMILDAIRQPYLIYEKQITLSFSIGITHFVGGNTSANNIITQADKAMYRAKYSGKNRFCIYDSALDS